jgi:6-phosphogluconolactonase (cycloisomerase 2 family)
MLKESLVFVGTYTKNEGSQSEGIYVYQMENICMPPTVGMTELPAFLSVQTQGD